MAKRDDLHGALCTLRAVTPDDISKIHGLCQKPEICRALHLPAPPTADELRELLFTKNKLHLWKLVPQGQAVPQGMAGYRIKCGYPFIFLHFNSGKLDIDLAEDMILAFMHDYFKVLRPKISEVFQTDPLMIVLPIDSADEMHGFFLENGFDPMTDHWAVDYKTQLAYAIYPETYQAYYGEEPVSGDEEHDEELEA